MNTVQVNAVRISHSIAFDAQNVHLSGENKLYADRTTRYAESCSITAMLFLLVVPYYADSPRVSQIWTFSITFQKTLAYGMSVTNSL